MDEGRGPFCDTCGNHFDCHLTFAEMCKALEGKYKTLSKVRALLDRWKADTTIESPHIQWLNAAQVIASLKEAIDS